jgi:biopolymer transport protein ExbB
MKTIFACALALIFAVAADSREKKKDVLEIELTSLNEVIQGVRDSLESEIAARYSFKQHTVEQREADKEEYEQLREKQEVVLTNLSKIKEEALVKEQNLGEAKKNAKEKQEEWVQVKNSFDEMMQKEADGLIEVFPADLERRRAALEEVRRLNREKGDPLSGWDPFLRYRISMMAVGRTVGITQQKLLPNDGAPRMFSIARFGNVFAFCMDTSQKVYMIRQTGHLGADRYGVEAVLSPELRAFLVDVLPQWIQKNKISGMVMCEVMQNEQARILVAGQGKSSFQKFIHEIKAGGLIMVPLLFLPFWVVTLVLKKMLQFWSRRRKYVKQQKTAFAFIDSNNTAKALTYVKSEKGMMAKILEICLDSPRDRDHAENGVRKLIMHETPIINRSLNTIAVIAGAAPLLGLLGTISGMITLFSAVTYYGTGDPKFLAGGISEALITAKTGLFIAIPTLFLHDYLRGRRDHLMNDIEAMALAALDKIVPEK